MVNNSYQVNKKKDTAITIFIATIFVLALVGVFTLFHLMTTQIKSSEKITSEVAQQLSYNVHNRIVGDLQVLEMIASSIGYNVRNFKPKDLTAYLTTGGRQASFKAFSFIARNRYVDVLFFKISIQIKESFIFCYNINHLNFTC